MPSRLEVYKCTHCGNIVEVLHGGKAPLICCGEPMKQLREGQTDGASEKHVPVIEKTESIRTIAKRISGVLLSFVLSIFSSPLELLGFFVKSVLAAEPAVFVKLNSVRVVLLVLLCVIVSLLTLGANQSDLDSCIISHFSGTSHY